MPWSAILPKITFWDPANPWTVVAGGTVSSVSAGDQASIISYLETLYNGSTTAAGMIDSWAAAGLMRIGQAGTGNPGFAVGSVGGAISYLGLNLTAIGDLHYFNTSGTFVKEKPEITIIHEISHLLGTRDPVYNVAAMNGASFDFDGDALRKQNVVAGEMGLNDNKQVSYHSSVMANDARFSLLSVGNSYTRSGTVQIVRLGDDGGTGAADTIDNSSRTDNSRDLLMGFTGDDTIKGGGGDDFAYGGADKDELWGGDGADVLVGEAGDDKFYGEKGADEFWGGGIDVAAAATDGTDEARYDKVGTVDGGAITVTLSSDAGKELTVTGDDGGIDTLHSIEKIVGSKAMDTLAIKALVPGALADSTGKAGLAEVDLGANPGGADQGDLIDLKDMADGVKVDLAAGRVELRSNSSVGFKVTNAERVEGGKGDDILILTDADDKTKGNGGADEITGGKGNDQLDGGDGTDTAVFADKIANYDIKHNADGTWTVSHVRGDKSDGTDTLTSIEQAKFGDTSTNLALNSVVSQVDFALVFDTTGSMGSYIGAVQAQMASIVNAAFQGGNMDARISIAGFKDPGEVQTYLSFTDQVELSARQSAALSAIYSIGVDGGGDTPEGAYSGALHVLTGGAGEWREEAIARRIVLVTDAPAKDTDLAGEVARYAADVGVGVASFSSVRVAGGSLTTATFTATASGDVPTPVQIYTILVGSDWTAEATIRAMAEQNGGQFFDADNMDELTDAILKVFSSPLNQAPVIVSDGGGDAATILLGEGDLSVTTVHATDANVADTITYRIVGGADAGLFAIDGVSGDVTFLAAGGELPADADGDGAYELVVGASDGFASDSQALSVVVEGGAGIELLGGNGKDELTGTRGSDLLTGGNGQDLLLGLAGNDTLVGGNGSDVLDGGDGRDLLSGGNGADVLSGGGGADVFAFGRNGGADTIVDFETALDRILLGGISVESHDTADVNRDGIVDLTIVFSGGSSATLLGVSDFGAIGFESGVMDVAAARAGGGMLAVVDPLFA